MPTLISVVRDREGKLHKPSEKITILSVVNHANFDPRQLLNVVFEDGNKGAVFAEELEK